MPPKSSAQDAAVQIEISIHAQEYQSMPQFSVPSLVFAIPKCQAQSVALAEIPQTAEGAQSKPASAKKGKNTVATTTPVQYLHDFKFVVNISNPDDFAQALLKEQMKIVLEDPAQKVKNTQFQSLDIFPLLNGLKIKEDGLCCELLQSRVSFSLEAIVSKSPVSSRVPLKNWFPFSLQVLQFEGLPINPNTEWREEELVPVSATLNVFGQKFTSRAIK